MLEKLWDYLKTRSQEEISEIFEEVRKIMESREAKTNLKEESDGGFNSSRGRGSPYNEKMNVRENLKSAFRFCSEAATLGMERIISFSKVASATASSIASDGKESIKVSSRMLNNKWNDLSPRDRKIITDVIIALIEIGLLRGSSKGKKAAFAVLSSVTRHQTPSRSDLEEFMAGAERFFKGRR